MADTFRYRHGDTRPVMMAVDSSTVIEVGDLIYLDTDDAKPASSQSDQSSEAANQRLFAAKFLGVSEHRSRNGDTDAIKVATAGVFEFDCPSSSFEVGDLVGVDEAASGTALEDQKVASVAATDLSIAKVHKTTSSATTVKVDIQSAVMNAAEIGGLAPYIPSATQQALSDAGAVNVTAYYTAWTTTGAAAGTLADGVRLGQLKKVQLIVDGGDGTLTPATFADGTTITFADAGDYAVLMWTTSGWTALELGNDADGATAPVVA